MHRSLLLITLITSAAFAASSVVSTSAPTSLPTQAPTLSPTNVSAQTAPALGLKWNENQRVFTVSVSNPGTAAMQVLGVQTTNQLYVSQFPQAIPAKGSATFTLLYYSQSNTTSTGDLLLVLTDQGEISVQIDHARDPVLQLSASSLSWRVGETANAKTIPFTVTPGTAVPKDAVAFGPGNHAVIASLGGGNYRLVVTPASTASQQSFPVIIELDPQTADVSNVVTCTVTPN